MKKQLQKNDILKAGGLGTIGIGGNSYLVRSALFSIGQATLTVLPINKELPPATPIEDTEFEIINPKECVFDIAKIQERMKELGALEDIDHEVINKKQLK